MIFYIVSFSSDDELTDPIETTTLSRIVTFTFSSNGTTTTGEIYLPSSYQTNKNLPAIYLIDFTEQHFKLATDKLSEDRRGELSKVIRERVTKAREIQTKRFETNEKVYYNAQMNVKQIRKYCELNETSKDLLKNAMDSLNLSARAYDRILKVARTIADLTCEESISPDHIAEAIQYRSLDREGWLG